MGNYLQHHGILGQRWYHRRFQNPDGSLTPEGKIRYANKAWDRLTKDKKAREAAAKDAAVTMVSIYGKYGGMNNLEREMYLEKATEELRSGKLKLDATFERSYEEGAVICKVQDLPVSKLIVGRHGQILSQIADEWLPAVQEYYDFLESRKEKKRNTMFMDAKKGPLTRDQAKVVDDIKAFTPKKADHRYFDEDEAMTDFNRQFSEQFGDINLFDNQELMDAYDDKLVDFLDDAFS